MNKLAVTQKGVQLALKLAEAAATMRVSPISSSDSAIAQLLKIADPEGYEQVKDKGPEEVAGLVRIMLAMLALHPELHPN